MRMFCVEFDSVSSFFASFPAKKKKKKKKKKGKEKKKEVRRRGLGLKGICGLGGRMTPIPFTQS